MSQFIYKDVPIEVEDYQEQAELATATTTEPTQMATTETPAQTAVVEEEQEGQLPLAPSGFRIYRRFKVGGATATKSKKSGKKTNPSYEKLAVDIARYVTHDDPALVDPNFDPLQDSHARISRRPDDFYPTRTPYETRVYPGSPAEEKGYKARGHYLMDVVKGSSELTLFEEGTEYHEDEMFAGF